MVQTNNKIKNLIDNSVVIFSVGSIFHCSDGNDYTVKQYEFDTKYEKNFGELIITFDKTITTEIYKKDGVKTSSYKKWHFKKEGHIGATKFYVVSITNPDGSVFDGKPNLYYDKKELEKIQKKNEQETSVKVQQQDVKPTTDEYTKNLAALTENLGNVIISINSSLLLINDKIDNLIKQLQNVNKQEEKIIDDPIKVLNSIITEIQGKQQKHEDEFTKFKNEITSRINALEEQINNIKIKKPQNLFEESNPIPSNVISI